MMTKPQTRALQHLLVQGFTLYSAEAAICTRLVAPSVLNNTQHVWAVIFDKKSIEWTAKLPDNDPYKEAFSEAAVRAQDAHHVVCHTEGALLILPLEVTDVRTSRVRIEAAVALKLAPPAERLEAFPDELIEREAKRRLKSKSREAS